MMYGQQTGAGGMNEELPNRQSFRGFQFGARPGGGLGGNRFMEPTLDLTSGMMEMDGQDIRNSDGVLQLPRPHEYIRFNM